jgi:hypothetical protein
MITLCTGNPTASANPQQVIVTVPSGAGEIQIAMTPHQAIILQRAARDAAFEALDRCKPEAKIIALHKRRRRAGRR